jgi:hypothetical protein
MYSTAGVSGVCGRTRCDSHTFSKSVFGWTITFTYACLIPTVAASPSGFVSP